MAIYFYTQIFVRDGLAVDFALCRIWRDHGRDFSCITSGSDGIPSGLTEIPQNPEFLSRLDHGKSRRDIVGIPTGSRRDIAGIPSGYRRDPVGIPQNPEFLSRWDPSESRWDPGESRRDPSESRRDPDYIPVESH